MLHRLCALAAAAMLVVPGSAGPLFHCDGMDGPVVRAAQAALETGNVDLILIWVQPADEAEIREAFGATLAARRIGPEVQALVDRFLFETVVRVHRAGEGAGFTGLKPVGRELSPAILAADKAVADGTAEPLVELVQASVENGLRERLQAVLRSKSYRPDDLAAGREHVKAYVEFVHYVERLYDAARAPAHGHLPEPETSHHH